MTANIRIVQSTLRASRKNKLELNKKAKIILPILNHVDWLDNDNSDDLQKVREVIYEMSLEDETIMTKIKVYKISLNNKNEKENKNNNFNENNDFKYDEEFTKNLKLKTIPRHSLDITYEKAKKIIKEKNININNKDMYYKLCEKDFRLPKNPEERYKGKFDWIEYLNIPIIYYKVEETKEKIKSYFKVKPELKHKYLDLKSICTELCKFDDRFPPDGLWVEYYKVKELADIISISNIGKKKGAILD
jgi:hypothetical protein